MGVGSGGGGLEEEIRRARGLERGRTGCDRKRDGNGSYRRVG